MNASISPAYDKFFAKFPEIETKPVNEWEKAHILSYLCQKYKNYYGFNFTFSFKTTAPSKSREIWEISKMQNQLSADPLILKEYIDWVFKEKIIQRKKKITSLGYFTYPDIINEFKFKFLSSQAIGRTTSLPEKYKAICLQFNLDINTYGDLSFVMQMKGKEDVLAAIRNAGLDLKILEAIK